MKTQDTATIFVASLFGGTILFIGVSALLPFIKTNLKTNLKTKDVEFVHEIIHREPPPGDKVMVSEDGKAFMPLVHGKYLFSVETTYTSYQDAVNRLWQYHAVAGTNLPDVFDVNAVRWQEIKK